MHCSFKFFKALFCYDYDLDWWPGMHSLWLLNGIINVFKFWSQFVTGVILFSTSYFIYLASQNEGFKILLLMPRHLWRLHLPTSSMGIVIPEDPCCLTLRSPCSTGFPIQDHHLLPFLKQIHSSFRHIWPHKQGH